MTIANLVLKLGVYTSALVGFFTLLPLKNNVTFTEYSVTQQRPFTGPLALNEKLSGISKLFEGKIVGPEGLLFYNNTLYTTLHYGHVVKIVDNEIVPVVKFGKVCDGLHDEQICGRPLGLCIDKTGFLYVADAYYGIFKVNLNPEQYGRKEQLVSIDEVIDGVRPQIPNSVAIASDGTLYWTDSDTNYKLHDGLYTLFVDGTGRFLKYDPKTKKNTVLMKNLQFANGIELSDDESFILVAETGKYRVHKYYLKGHKAGKSEIFIDGLPGMPDNIKRNGRGSFYIPLVIPRIPIVDSIGEYPTIRMMITKSLAIIDFTLLKINSLYPNLYCKRAFHWIGHFESISFIKSIARQRLSVLKVNEQGKVLSSYHSTDGKVTGICDVEVIDDKLYLGSPFNTFLGVIKLPQGFL
ncbi:adipocyte plasma membrane-associated protein-like [Myzus persicae]|uniref:adipocyte plasma membrane-associated protein-like n=1 Tax=Myzus persicae TaxID=13164 RepID=UPI000B92F907|nr:adipocyte plasma membrane-associated protein-like [Myzus persicae]XP_022178956.1 adipocyte plasma membrane-associated protein-like [Myzus persicae]